MKIKWIQLAEFAAVAVFALMILLFFQEGLMANHTAPSKPYNSDWSVTAGETSVHWDTLPGQVNSQGIGEIRLTHTLEHGITESNYIGFYTIHELVKVYLDTQLIYELKPSEKGVSKTPGNQWNFVQVKDFYAGHELTIVLKDSYSKGTVVIPRFSFGNDDSMILSFIKDKLAAFEISLLMLLIGMGTGIYWIFARKKTELDDAVPRLGLFAVSLAMWSTIECQLLPLFFGMPLLFTQLSFLSLKLMLLCMLQFYGGIYDMQKDKVLKVLSWAAIIDFWGCLVLQLAGIADFKETSLLNVSLCVLTVLYLAYNTILMFAKHIKRSKDSRRVMLIHAVCLFIVAIFAGIDLVRFFMPNELDAAEYTRIGLLIYLIGLLIMTLDDSIQLMKEGKDAHRIKLEAEEDIMTKLKNRSAFEQDMSDIDPKDYADYGIVMCDLNNLKMFNDLHGHSMGDYYIITCATVIRDIYGVYGTAYRIGGDEFCAVVKGLGEEEEEGLRQEMHRRTESMKLEDQKFALHMEIASGYAHFDPEKDKDLSDTMERADQVMYTNKVGMKHGEKPR